MNLSRADDAIKARLTTWLVEQRRLGVDCPEVMSTTVDEAENRPALKVHERADQLLRHMQKRLPTIGSTVKYPVSGQDAEMHAALAWSESIKLSEVTYLLDYLVKLELLEKPPYLVADFIAEGGGFGDPQLSALKPSDRLPPALAGFTEYTITPSGYAHLAEIETKSVGSDQAFIAMWFDPSMGDAYRQGIEQGVLEAGYRPIRIDQKDHNNKIDDEIIAEIRRSRFVVADFTHGEAGMRGGVYYEAGFAHGLNIPVIFTCREDVIGKIHFDTRQYNHITWKPDELDEFRKALSDRISATIGDGPLKKNS
ncbi:hypothetical protein JCM17843_09800 [Kordiimonadales bacterium JCM 17843]|nr:hypothetical protein JCM17843_09800 [Kordiimonadales bacterium JCM 17843]